MAFCGKCGAYKENREDTCPSCGRSSASTDTVSPPSVYGVAGSTQSGVFNNFYDQKFKPFLDRTVKTVSSALATGYSKTKDFLITQYSKAKSFVVSQFEKIKQRSAGHYNEAFFGEIVNDEYSGNAVSVPVENRSDVRQTHYDYIQPTVDVASESTISEPIVSEPLFYPSVVIDDGANIIPSSENDHSVILDDNNILPDSRLYAETSYTDDPAMPDVQQIVEVQPTDDEFEMAEDSFFLSSNDNTCDDNDIQFESMESEASELTGENMHIFVESHDCAERLIDNPSTQQTVLETEFTETISSTNNIVSIPDNEVDLYDTLLETENARLENISSDYASDLFKRRGHRLRVASVIIGILGILLSISVLGGILFSLVAIILSLISRALTLRKDNKRKLPTDVKNVLRKKGRAGIVLGLIGIILSIVFLVTIFVYFIFFGDVFTTVENILDYVFGEGKYYPAPHIWKPIADFFESIRTFLGL